MIYQYNPTPRLRGYIRASVGDKSWAAILVAHNAKPTEIRR